MGRNKENVMFDIFLLIYFLSLKESIFETRKSISYSTSKALFVLEILTILKFWNHHEMMSSNSKA